MRVLILEDDPDISGFLEDALRTRGHEPTSFGHAGLALGAIARGKFELLLCDLMLPNVHGIDAMRMARSQFPYLPIIAISALDEGEWRDKCYKAGASCFIPKPIKLDTLLDELDLIQRSQVDLDIAVIDPDDRHRERIVHELTSVGCNVAVFESFGELHRVRESHPELSVLLIDHTDGGIEEALRWTSGRNMAAVVFGNDTPDFSDDEVLRLGASFTLMKPVDTEALMIQARFFVSPGPSPGHG